MEKVKAIKVTADENDIRLDRWFRRHYPGLTHGRLEKLLRTGQVRVDGKRAKANARLEEGQEVRVPPLPEEASQMSKEPRKIAPTDKDRKVIRDSILFEDKDVLVINKPAGLAVQGGTGISRHLDGFLTSIYAEEGLRPKLVHRLDKETSGVFVLAKTDFAAAALSRSFRERTTRKYYWALTYGVPKPKQGKIQLSLAKGSDGRMREDADEGKNAVTLYQVVQSAMKVAFVALWPLTGRTHQLRAHMQALDTPILGDDMYAFDKELFVDGDLQLKKLHLHARRLIIPHPRKGRIDVTAPLPDHLKKSWKYFEFPQDDEDPFASYGDAI
jgi:23S rRNA pseudouridine955/2504/2580 synthase